MGLGQNTVVLASAGTGKTRKLVNTFVDLIAGGADPLRIVAMTFTEKAAGEMRDRVRSAVYEKMASLPPSEHGKWMRVIGLIPAAHISTIHGFCGLLLREHGLAAGVDPSFSILDEQQSLDLAREAAVDTLRNELRDGNTAVERLFGDFGLNELVRTMVTAAYWVNSLGKDPAWLQERADRQIQLAAELRASVASHLAEHGNDFERIGLFADEQVARRTRHPFRKQDDPEAILPRIGQIAGAAVARDLAGLISLSVARFRSAKDAANTMDFDDLLLRTRDLLRDVPEVRRKYQNHFEAVLVDEFQDTDEVQAEIIRLLAQDPQEETRFAPGKLLIVGDPKQSIYRFRRARVTVFVRMIEEIRAGGGAVEHLEDNYRSAPPLVEFSNRLSRSMMDGAGKRQLPPGSDTSYRIAFQETDALEARSAEPFWGITYIAADPGLRAAAGRACEAEAIARLLKTWKASGLLESWKDVALLMRTMTNAHLYVDALEAHGIPVYVVQGSAFYQKCEVSDLIAVLEMVLRPGDRAARAAVFTSGIAGVSFNDLVRGETPESMKRIEKILQPWIEQRDRATAAEILEDVIRKTNFDAVLMAQKNGDQRVANIGKLIEMTRSLARRGTTALDDVVRHLKARAEDAGVREPEAQILGQDQDVVRVLTVHQAKGLEFRAVVVPDLAARTRSSGSESIFFSDRWGLLAGAAYGLHRKPLPHSLILAGRQEEEDQQFEEEKRLLYVAVTRAQSMLVLGEGFCEHSGPWLGWVRAFFDSTHPSAIETARNGKSHRVRFRRPGLDFHVQMEPVTAYTKPEQLTLNIDIAAVNRDTAYRDLQALRQTVAVPKAFDTASLEMTPSDLVALDGCFRYFNWTRIFGLADPARRPSGDTPQMQMGTLAHRVMEIGVPLAEAVLSEQGLQDLDAVFASEEWQELSGMDMERELPFIMHVRAAGRDCFVRGRMDAVVVGDPPRVIDYKFALWKPGREAVYEIQMIAYCLALMKSLGTDRAVAEIWYLKAPMKVIRTEYTRRDAEERVAKLLAQYLQSLESGDWSMASRAYCDAMECGFIEKCWGAAAS